MPPSHRLDAPAPSETGTARTADLWLPVRPGTYIAVLKCLLRQLIQDGCVDEAYVRERTVGWDEVRQAVASYTPERAERIAGVPAERIVAAARLWGRAERGLVMHARGIEHSTHGVDNCLAAASPPTASGVLTSRAPSTTSRIASACTARATRASSAPKPAIRSPARRSAASSRSRCARTATPSTRWGSDRDCP